MATVGTALTLAVRTIVEHLPTVSQTPIALMVAFSVVIPSWHALGESMPKQLGSYMPAAVPERKPDR